MRLDDILEQVAPEWRADFRDFTDTGRLTAAFQDYLDRDPSGQRALDLIFTAQAEAFDDFVSALDAEPSDVSQSTVEIASNATAAEDTQLVAAALSAVTKLPEGLRRNAVAQIGAELRGSLKPLEREEAHEVIVQLDRVITAN
jgi:hypothetical protein